MSLRNIFLKLAHDVSRYPNIVQLTNTLDHGFKEVAANITEGDKVVVTPYSSEGDFVGTIKVNDETYPLYSYHIYEGSPHVVGSWYNGSTYDEVYEVTIRKTVSVGANSWTPMGIDASDFKQIIDVHSTLNTTGACWSSMNARINNGDVELLTFRTGGLTVDTTTIRYTMNS